MNDSALAYWKSSLLVLPLLLGLALRLVVLSWTDPVAFDSAIYFEMAEFVRAGAWQKVLAYDYPPLFPAMIASLETLGVPPPTAGLLLACGLNLAVILPLFLITRELAGPRAAFAAAFLWAAHPYAVRLSVRALSDSPTASFVAFSIWIGLRALRRNNALSAFLAGILSGFAYLTRPEGAEAALGLAVLYLTVEPTRSSAGSARRFGTRILWASIPVIGWTLVASPYIASISHEAGTLTLSKKKSVQSMLGSVAPVAPVNERPAASDVGKTSDTSLQQKDTPLASPTVQTRERRGWLGRAAWNSYLFQRPLVNGLYPVILFLAIWGIFEVRYGKTPVERSVVALLGGLSGLHLLVVAGVASIAGAQYLGGHHFFLLSFYLMPFAGAGVAGAVARIQSRYANFSWAPATVTVVIAITIIPAPLTWHDSRGHSLRLAGLWVRQRLLRERKVVTNDAKFSFHAGAQRIGLHGNYKGAIDHAREQGASFVGLSLDSDSARELEPLIRSGDVKLAVEFAETSGKRVYRYQVYRILPPAW